MTNVTPLRQAQRDVPPSDVDAEKAGLSAALISPELATVLFEVCTADHFYLEAHKWIARALQEASPPNITTVATWLRDIGRLQTVGGTPYLGELIDLVPASSPSDVDGYGRIIREKFVLRTLKSQALAFAALCQTGSVEDPIRALRDFANRAEALHAAQQSPFDIEGPEQIFAQLAPVNWLCKELQLAPGRPNLLGGPGYGGKSIIAAVIAFAVSSGQLLFGKFPCRTGKVVHLNYDQGNRVPKSRYQRMMRTALMAPQDFGDRLNLVNHPKVYLDSPNAEEAFTRICDGCALLIIDSFRAALLELDENDSRVRGPLNMLIRVSDATGCTILVVHHSRKPAQGAPVTKNEIRGSSAIFEACESVYMLDPDPEKVKPTRVIHEKAGITGVTRDDFLLRVHDVEIDGAPRGGLAVTIEDVGNVDVFEATAAANRGKLDRLKAKLVDEFRKSPTLPGSEVLATRINHRPSAIREALLALEDEGLIEVRGTTRNRQYAWIGGAH